MNVSGVLPNDLLDTYPQWLDLPGCDRARSPLCPSDIELKSRVIPEAKITADSALPTITLSPLSPFSSTHWQGIKKPSHFRVIRQRRVEQ